VTVEAIDERAIGHGVFDNDDAAIPTPTDGGRIGDTTIGDDTDGLTERLPRPRVVVFTGVIAALMTGAGDGVILYELEDAAIYGKGQAGDDATLRLRMEGGGSAKQKRDEEK